MSKKEAIGVGLARGGKLAFNIPMNLK